MNYPGASPGVSLLILIVGNKPSLWQLVVLFRCLCRSPLYEASFGVSDPVQNDQIF
jgi:hypothetical protein